MEYNPKKEFSFFLQIADLEDPLDLSLVPSNPNFDAATAFLCDSIEDFLILAPIVKAMPESEFVFLHSDSINNEKEKRAASLKLNYLLKLASSNGLYCRLYYQHPKIKYQPGQSPVIEAHTLFDFFEKYELLVGARLMGPLSLSPITHKKKLLFCEHPAEWLQFGDLSHIDAIATPGPYQASLFSIFAPSRAVGSPRLEAIKNRSAPKTPSKAINSIIYLPSKSNLLLKETADSLLDALPDNIRLKIFIPHFRAVSKHLWKQRETAPGIEIFFYGDKDPAELIADSDAAIIEDPVYLIDCIFLEKPMILLDRIFARTTQFDEFQQFQPQENTKSFGISDPTVSDCGLVLKKPSNLKEALKILEDKKALLAIQETQKKLKEAFVYLPKYGAAKTSIEFIGHVKNMPRSTESLISRAWKHWERLSALRDHYSKHYGVTTPLGHLQMRILRLIMEREQE